MKLNRSEQLVKGFLESLDLTAEALVPVGDRKTADFLATDSADVNYLIEVESQADDLAYWSELEERGQVNRTDEVMRTNVASRVVRHAAKQLRETEAPEHSFNLLAIVPASDDPGTQASEFRSTLYGIMLLVDAESSGEHQTKDCFYFDYNEFYEMRDIEGALLFDDSGCQLCINTFAERADAFRNSVLCQRFDKESGVLDPDALEAGGQAYIADIDLPRSESEKLLDYVMEKYSLSSRPIPMRLQQLRGELKVDLGDDD
jgi:hypothetical protein